MDDKEFLNKYQAQNSHKFIFTAIFLHSRRIKFEISNLRFQNNPCSWTYPSSCVTQRGPVSLMKKPRVMINASSARGFNFFSVF